MEEFRQEWVKYMRCEKCKVAYSMSCPCEVNRREFTKLMNQALLSYGAWLIENGVPKAKDSKSLEEVYQGHALLDVWRYNDTYNQALADVKAKMEELNV